MKIANRDAYRYVKNKLPFEGSNLRGQWMRPDAYVVYSYETPIYIWSGGETFVNRVRYSNTTTRHVTCCRVRNSDYEVIEADLYYIINQGVGAWKEFRVKSTLEGSTNNA